MTLDTTIFGDKAVQERLVDICLKKPLYRKLASGREAHKLAKELAETSFKFDAYCVGCKKEATFQRLLPAKKQPIGVNPMGGPAFEIPIIVNQTVTANCTRGPHQYSFFFGPYLGAIAKVGQSLSLADIASGDLTRFAGVLDDLDLRELHQAIRLYSHGAAIGAFVYLRRIFERLLDRHRQMHVEKSGPIEGFNKLAVEDKVLQLADVLPEEVVANRKIYGVLSKGVHELLEEECLIHYDIMHAAMVDILEHDIYNRKRAKTSADLRHAVGVIAGQVSGGKKDAARKIRPDEGPKAKPESR